MKHFCTLCNIVIFALTNKELIEKIIQHNRGQVHLQSQKFVVFK